MSATRLDSRYRDRCSNCAVIPPEEEYQWYCVTKGAEHAQPEKYCRAPTCHDTNWGGYARLHSRGSQCPPYTPNPEPNPMAEFWEGVRELARQNGRRNREQITTTSEEEKK